MAARYTSELANDFGNLASRLIAMIEKYCDGKIPSIAKDESLSALLDQSVKSADDAICALDFQGGINTIMDFCKRVNGYVTEKEPWVVAKDSSRKSELDGILYNTAESLRALAVLLHPVMPEVTQKLWQSLGAQSSLGDIGKQQISKVANWGQLPAGSVVTKTDVLFPRLEEVK
jgi:methionyl-tRNA synthetase